jgi:hypothetical protein
MTLLVAVLGSGLTSAGVKIKVDVIFFVVLTRTGSLQCSLHHQWKREQGVIHEGNLMCLIV